MNMSVRIAPRVDLPDEHPQVKQARLLFFLRMHNSRTVHNVRSPKLAFDPILTMLRARQPLKEILEEIGISRQWWHFRLKPFFEGLVGRDALEIRLAKQKARRATLSGLDVPGEIQRIIARADGFGVVAQPLRALDGRRCRAHQVEVNGASCAVHHLTARYSPPKAPHFAYTRMYLLRKHYEEVGWHISHIDVPEFAEHYLVVPTEFLKLRFDRSSEAEALCFYFSLTPGTGVRKLRRINFWDFEDRWELPHAKR